jgi:hypothetical protein
MMKTKSPLTTKNTLDVDQIYALSYALSVGIFQAKGMNDKRLLTALESVDDIVNDRIEALG